MTNVYKSSMDAHRTADVCGNARPGIEADNMSYTIMIQCLVHMTRCFLQMVRERLGLAAVRGVSEKIEEEDEYDMWANVVSESSNL